MAYQIYLKDKATKKRPESISIIAEFETEQEAKQYYEKEVKEGFRNIGTTGIREKPLEQRPIDTRSGQEITGPTLGSGATPRELERERLAGQAESKRQQGIQLSTAEAEAAQRYYKDFGTAREVNQDINIQREKRAETERRFLETYSKIQEQNTPTTREQFITSLADRSQNLNVIGGTLVETKGERKRVFNIATGKQSANIPLSAEYSKGFESELAIASVERKDVLGRRLGELEQKKQESLLPKEKTQTGLTSITGKAITFPQTLEDTPKAGQMFKESVEQSKVYKWLEQKESDLNIKALKTYQESNLNIGQRMIPASYEREEIINKYTNNNQSKPFSIIPKVHDIQEEGKEIIKLSKGYGYGVGSKFIKATRTAIAEPADTAAFVIGGTGLYKGGVKVASKVLPVITSKLLVGSTVIGGPVALEAVTAPPGEKIRTAAETGGMFAITGLALEGASLGYGKYREFKFNKDVKDFYGKITDKEFKYGEGGFVEKEIPTYKTTEDIPLYGKTESGKLVQVGWQEGKTVISNKEIIKDPLQTSYPYFSSEGTIEGRQKLLKPVEQGKIAEFEEQAKYNQPTLAEEVKGTSETSLLKFAKVTEQGKIEPIFKKPLSDEQLKALRFEESLFEKRYGSPFQYQLEDLTWNAKKLKNIPFGQTQKRSGFEYTADIIKASFPKGKKGSISISQSESLSKFKFDETSQVRKPTKKRIFDDEDISARREVKVSFSRSPKVTFNTASQSRSVSSRDSVLNIIPLSLENNKVSDVFDLDSSVRFKVTNIPKVEIASAQTPKSDERIISFTLLNTITDVIEGPPQKKKDELEPTPEKPPTKIPRLKFDDEQPKKPNSYDVQIRRGDKRGDRFVTIARGLPENKARSTLVNAVDNYIESAGRLVPSRAKPKTEDDLFGPSLNKFRGPKGKSKLPYNTYIERELYRLDTSSEVAQISFFKSESKSNLLPIL